MCYSRSTGISASPNQRGRSLHWLRPCRKRLRRAFSFIDLQESQGRKILEHPLRQRDERVVVEPAVVFVGFRGNAKSRAEETRQ